MQQQDNHEYPFLYQRQTCHQVQPNQATYQKRQKCQPATYLQEVLYQLDRKSGSAGMPRPTSYAVFCLKNKMLEKPFAVEEEGRPGKQVQVPVRRDEQRFRLERS